MTKLKDMTLTFGDSISARVGDLPESVQHVLMQRTFSHIMGNEAAAVRSRLMSGDEPLTADEADERIAEWRQEKLEAMLAGKFTLRVVGPRLTADETIARDFARQSIINQATAKKVALPKASDKEAWERGIDNWLARPANKALADAEIARRKAAFTAPEADVGDVDSLFAKAG